MEWIQKCSDAFPAKRDAHNGEVHDRHRQESRAGEIFPAQPGKKKDNCCDKSEACRLAKIGLDRDETCKQPEHDQAGKQAFPGLVDLRLVVVQVCGQEHQKDELCNLRGLEGEVRSKTQPAVRAVDARLCKNRSETCNAEQDHPTNDLALLKDVVVLVHQDDHQDVPCRGVDELAQEIIRGHAMPGGGDDRGRTVNHDQPEDGKHAGSYEQHPVIARLV